MPNQGAGIDVYQRRSSGGSTPSLLGERNVYFDPRPIGVPFCLDKDMNHGPLRCLPKVGYGLLDIVAVKRFMLLVCFVDYPVTH